MAICPVHFSAILGLASAALALAFAPGANASIVGSTYDFTTSESGNTLIAPLGGLSVHTDPANPGFLRWLNRQPARLCHRRGGVRLL